MLHNKSGCKSLARPGSACITLKKVELKKLDNKGSLSKKDTYCILYKDLYKFREGNTHSGPPNTQPDRLLQLHCVLCIGTGQHLYT